VLYSASRRKFYRFELRDRGQHGFEVQVFDPAEFLYGHLFPHRAGNRVATHHRDALEKGV